MDDIYTLAELEDMSPRTIEMISRKLLNTALYYARKSHKTKEDYNLEPGI